MADYELVSFDVCPFVQLSAITLEEKKVSYNTRLVPGGLASRKSADPNSLSDSRIPQLAANLWSLRGSIPANLHRHRQAVPSICSQNRR